jgi:hypothetical protein
VVFIVPLLSLVLALLAAPCAQATPYPRYWQPISLDGATLPDLLGRPVHRIAVLRCDADDCVPIPFQIDERDSSGEWALPGGESPSLDESPGVFDDDDVMTFLIDDAGAPAPERARVAGALLEVRLDDPLGFPPRYVYLAATPGAAPRSPIRYVSYDPARDLLAGTVALGFAAGIPQFLALSPGGENVLDRLKIRATATFLWGLIRIGRSEEDLLPDAVSWSAGPIRVIRRQPLQIRMRFGIRSPRFLSTTYFYRDFAELPLHIRLRVPPRYFFTSITVRGGLDFRALPGRWRARLPGSEERLPAGCGEGVVVQRDGALGDWFALEGDDLTILQRLQRGPSLASVRETAWYRDGAVDDPPENAPAQCPGAGFALEDWGGVEGGVHTLTSTSYAVAPGLDADVFLATVDTPPEVSVTSLAQP